MSEPFDLSKIHPLTPKKPPKEAKADSFHLPDPLAELTKPEPPKPVAPPPVAEQPAVQSSLSWLVIGCRAFAILGLCVAAKFAWEYLTGAKVDTSAMDKDAAGIVRLAEATVAKTQLIAICLASAWSLAWWIAGEFFTRSANVEKHLQTIADRLKT